MNFIVKNQKKLLIIGGVIIFLGLIYYFVIDVMLIFMKNENIMLEAAEKYYATNSRELKEEGVSTVTLQTLYDDLWIEEALYEPHTTKLCSANDSWVKVRKEDEEYKYYIYLECGNLKSGVDHQGPEITLNGDNTVTVSKDTAYEELGVKKVKDNIDGELKIEDVTITGEVDITKVGIYEIKYRAKDSLDNETTVIREINVVETLSTIIEKDTSGVNYYQSDIANNYILFSGNLYQIVSMSDNNIKLISSTPISFIDYTSKNNTFEGSTIEKWLNEYYYESFSADAKEYMVATNYCIDIIDANNPVNTECQAYTEEKYKVGLLSVSEYNRSISEGTKTYINNSAYSWMINYSSNGKPLVNSTSLYSQFNVHFAEGEENGLYTINPVITIDKDVIVIDGKGSFQDPYKLNDYQYAKSGEQLSGRITGEYFEYSDYIFRIKGVNENKTVNAIMQDTITVDGENLEIKYETTSENNQYSPKENGNIGYIVEHESNNYIDTTLLVKDTYSILMCKDSVLYDACETNQNELKFIIPSMFELYSAQNLSVTNNNYWLRETAQETNEKYAVYFVGNIILEETGENSMYGMKLETTFDKDIKIVGGNGTLQEPYRIR